MTQKLPPQSSSEYESSSTRPQVEHRAINRVRRRPPRQVFMGTGPASVRPGNPVDDSETNSSQEAYIIAPNVAPASRNVIHNPGDKLKATATRGVNRDTAIIPPTLLQKHSRLTNRGHWPG